MRSGEVPGIGKDIVLQDTNSDRGPDGAWHCGAGQIASRGGA